MSITKEDPLTFLPPSSSSSSPSGDPSYLADHTGAPISSASGSFHSDTFLSGDTVAGGAGDFEFGFLRPEFGQSELVGTAQYCSRHVFLCYKNPRNWPPRIEAAEFDRLPRILSAALNARKGDMRKETRLTICEGHDGTETSNGDVLIFPDMVRYRRLTHFDVDTFVEEVLFKEGEWLPGNPEKLKGFYVFVCCHGSRDRRCGVCGPPVVARFKEEVEAHGLKGKVSISPCSHVGGHKYAGNVIIFGQSTSGEVTGHWYGYVTPDHVPILLDQHILKGEIVESLWRGQMGLTEEEQRKAQELRLQNDNGTSMGRSIDEPSYLNEIENSSYGSHFNGNTCCQTNGNTVCCQSRTMEQKKDNLNKSEDKVAAEKKTERKISRKNSYKGGASRKGLAMSSWFESWEREDTYAALSVVCAAVSIGVAYSCYKQL